MKSMFDDNKEVVNEDTATGIPYLSLGGVFTQDMSSLSRFVGVNDKLQLQRAIIDMFKLFPVVTDDMIKKLAANLNMPEDVLENEIYAIMSSFWNRGLFHDNPNVPIDPQQLQMGIKVEMEHTDNIFVAERISLDHLVELPNYYSHLSSMEQEYEGKK